MRTLKIADSDGIAIVTFARPPVNTMDSTSLEELTATFERLAGDAAVKAAVLTGEGSAFSAGLDLKMVPNLDLAGQHRLITALKIRQSAQSAAIRPPAMACPFTAATRGLGQA